MALSPLFLITPTLGWTWPSLLPIAMAIAAGHGYKKLTSNDQSAWLRGRLTKEMENLRRVSVPIDELVEGLIADELGRDERLIFEKDNYRLIFRCDPRGKFFINILGPKAIPASVLRKEALEFTEELVQQFAYNRVVQEMEARGINVVKEKVDAENGDVILEIRRWT